MSSISDKWAVRQPFSGFALLPAGTALALRQVGSALAAFIGQSLLLALVPALIYLDLAVFGNGMSEGNLTEWAQSLLLLFATVQIYRVAGQIAAARAFLLLVAGFLLCMLIREQDGFLDALGKGSWAYLVALVALASLFHAWRAGLPAVVQPMAAFIGSRAYYYLLFALLLVLVFSRLFGSGHTIWQFIPGLENPKHFKNTVQEGIELAGYIFLFLSSVMLRRDGAASFSARYLPTAGQRDE